MAADYTRRYNPGMTKLVLFDLDGTLLSTQGAGMRAMARAGASLFGDGFHFEGISAAGGLPWRSMNPCSQVQTGARMDSQWQPHEHLETFSSRHLQHDESSLQLHHVRVLDGIGAYCCQLRQQDKCIRWF